MIRLYDYGINSDSITFIVGRIGKGDALVRPVYHRTLAQCVEWVRGDLIRRKVSTLDCDINTAVDALKTLDDDFKTKVLEWKGGVL
jgi:hypothetical protein